jgi:acyl phosphate:glycerol-3-phosphate acyltransferase
MAAGSRSVDITFTILLSVAAFILGAVPFSVIIGRLALNRDITTYGDGNPGAVNVFRAGGRKTGFLAVLLDVAKGVPMVLLSHIMFGLPALSAVVIATSAILGHAFSPFLRWRGGKAICVTFGVMLGLPDYQILLAFIVFVLIGFILIEVDAWKIICGAAGTLVFLFVTKAAVWELVLMFLVLCILTFKHFEDLHTLPHFRGVLVRWVQSIIRSAMF